MKTDQYSLLKEKLSSKAFSSIFVLVDDNTDKFCLDIFIKKTKIDEFNKITINSGEKNKNIDTCQIIWDKLNAFNADRKSLLINLGGGVLTDMGGFVASTYLRGITFINIPTTLLGMVDAAHGGKTGIDFKLLKNQIGLFSDPTEVILDSDYLSTLTKDEFLNLFFGIHVSKINSLESDYSNITPEPFFNLTVPLAKEGTLEKCIELYTKKEQLDGDNSKYIKAKWRLCTIDDF